MMAQSETSPRMNTDKIVNDAILGIINLKPHIIAIIDTPEFQRLRQIWQLGMAPFIYPTANHCRFEHSIGTYWLASKLVSKIKEQLDNEYPKYKIIRDTDVKCVEIAALCHDIGVGPFSHVWEKRILPQLPGAQCRSHEEQFPEMWEKLKENNPNVVEMLKNNHLDDNLIKSLVSGATIAGKEILFEIVCNPDSGMDVDKWDYLARDSTCLGHSTTNYRTEIDRMIHLARAIKDGDIWKIAYRNTDSITMLRVYQLRHYMHQTAYQHRTVIGIEQMFIDGVKECIDKGILSIDDVGSPNWILENTDSIFWSNVKNIIAFRNILTRRLYKAIFEATKYEDVDDPTKEVIHHLKKKGVQYDKLRFAFCRFSLGIREENPMYKIPFYKKNEKNCIFRFNESNLPSNLKMDFNESRIIIFSVGTFDNAEYFKDIFTTYFKDWRLSDDL